MKEEYGKYLVLLET